MKKSFLILAILFLGFASFAQKPATTNAPSTTAHVQLMDYNNGGIHNNTIYSFKITANFPTKEQWDNVRVALKSTKGLNNFTIDNARNMFWMDVNNDDLPNFAAVKKVILEKNKIVFDKGGYENVVNVK